VARTPVHAATPRAPRFPVDLSLFDGRVHTPSLLELERSMGRKDLALADFCIPINPYFPTPAVFARFRDELEQLLTYYPSPNHVVARTLAETLGLSPESVVLGNGSTELITFLDLLYVREGIAMDIPTFGRWTDQPSETGKRVHAWARRPEDDYALRVEDFVSFVRRSGARSVAICNPSNPTGALLARSEVLRLADALADLDLVVVDESFIEFASADASVARDAPERKNLVVLKSLGKNLGLHGVRLGYAATHPTRAEALRRALPHWNVNAIAEHFVSLLGAHAGDYEASKRRVIADRAHFAARLAAVPRLSTFPSQGNFVYARVPDDVDGVRLRNHLLTEFGILVRACGDKLGGSPQHFRLAVRPPAQADELAHALSRSLAELGAA
jgi:histidinol-phosphate/aromatic aminotransferase/cobyric acid decarboxylase-like protein